MNTLFRVIATVFREIPPDAPLRHFEHFFTVTIPFWFTDTIPGWLGWGTDSPNILGWTLIALGIAYVILFIAYLILQGQASRPLQSVIVVGAYGSATRKKKKSKKKAKQK